MIKFQATLPPIFHWRWKITKFKAVFYGVWKGEKGCETREKEEVREGG